MAAKGNKDKLREAKVKQSQNAAGAYEKMKTFLSVYDGLCQKYNTPTYTPLKRQLKTCIDESKLLSRFHIEPLDRIVTTFWEDEMLPNIFNGEEKLRKKRKKEVIPNLVKILPLLESIKSIRYIQIQELLVWGIMIEYGEIVTLAYLLNRKIYQLVKLELIDCLIDSKSLTVLAPTINKCITLRELVLDFNEFGDEGCEVLCTHLKKSIYLYTLSLNCCRLTKVSGYLLGEVVAKSTIRELFLENNCLENEGVIALLGAINMEIVNEIAKTNAINAALAEAALAKVETPVPEETLPEGETKEVEVPVKKKKKKPNKTKQVSLLLGPEICRLNLANNRIGRYGQWENFTPVLCTLQMKKLISICKDLEEIDIYGNDISDIAARQILEGLVLRKAAKYPQIGFRMCHIVNQDMFDIINKLAPGSKKKKKGGKKG